MPLSSCTMHSLINVHLRMTHLLAMLLDLSHLNRIYTPSTVTTVFSLDSHYCILIRQSLLYSHWKVSTVFSLDSQYCIPIGQLLLYSHWTAPTVFPLDSHHCMFIGQSQRHFYWTANAVCSLVTYYYNCCTGTLIND